MVDDLGIIHMNGRIYDPRIGRFLQADSIIDGVKDTQGYNRYSYVHNNPLNATDPSGFFSLKRLLGAVAVIALSVVTYGAASAWAIGVYGASCTVVCSLATASIVGGIAGGAAAGFAAGVAAATFAGANLHDSLRGGLQGATAGAVLGGIMGGVSSVVGRAPSLTGFMVNTVASGTVSELTGGKFANGARSSAFMYAVQWGAKKIRVEDRMESTDQNYGERGVPDNVDESYFQKNPDIEITKEVIDGEKHMTIKAKYTYENMTSEEALKIENGIEAGFNSKIDGAGYIHLDLVYDPQASSSLIFRGVGSGFCRGGYMCASVGGKYLNISDVTSKLWDVRAMKHEFGHMLGFKHAANGNLDFMSYDWFGEIKIRHFNALDKNY